MSELKVEVVKIDEIIKHDNAERLEIVRIKGWECVTAKGQFRLGDKAVYIPIDSVLPQELEEKIFEGTKVKLSKHKVKTIRIRGAISQGLIITLKQANLSELSKVGYDARKELRIVKYEPKNIPNMMNCGKSNQKKTKRNPNPNFNKYTDLQNVKNYNELFKHNEDDVIVTEKIHGTNFRVGYVKKEKGWFSRFLSWIGIGSDFEFAYGSHNVQLQMKGSYKGFYKSNLYAECVNKYNLDKILNPGEVVYGEIFASGGQKKYTYGCCEGERKLVIFDVKVNGHWLSYDEMVDFCTLKGLEPVLAIYRGKYDLDKIKEICSGNSKMFPKQKIIEGGVISSVQEEYCFLKRKKLKLINDKYLEQKNLTEFH